jgi:branched-chain amino acid transport system permease protein
MMTYIDYKNVVPKAAIGLLVLMILLIPVITTNEATLGMLILSGIWAVAVMGFTLVLRTGQFSLGQAAFMAIGGYTSAILTAQMGWSFWPAFFLAGLVSGFAALLIGMVVLRVGGIYFSIITLSLCEVVRIIAQQWESVTRGARGLITSPPNPISLGFFEINFFSSTVPYFYLTVCLVAVTALIFWRIGESRLGRSFAGVALNPVLAEHQGMYLMKYRVIAFTVAGVFTGLAGSLYAHSLTVITPTMLGLWQSIQIMIMSIVGGFGSLVGGPIIGSVILYTFGTYLTRLDIYGIQQLLFGAVVVLVLLFLPKGTGLVDLWGRFWTKVVWREEEFELDAEDE